MKQLYELELRIEDLRIRLNVLVVTKRFNMQDPDVISLSGELDCLIAEFLRAKQQLSAHLLFPAYNRIATDLKEEL